MIFYENNITEENFLPLVKYLINLIQDNNIICHEWFEKLVIKYINKSINLCNFNLIKFLIEYYNTNFGMKPILIDTLYIGNNKLDIIKYLFQNTTIYIDKKIINVILKLAIKHNNIDIVNYLIEKGANLNYCNYLDIASTNGNLQMVKFLIDNNINVNKFGYNSIKSCYDLNIVEYIINNFNEINYDTLYEKVVDVNFKVAKYLEDNYDININLLLLKTGNINIIIKNINDYVLHEKLNINLLEYNSESKCILFFVDIIKSHKNLKYLDDNYEKFLEHCIKIGYLKLLIFMINNIKKYEIKNINNIIEFYIIEYSKCEDDALFLINNISYIEKDKLNLSKIIVNSINNKYLKLIKLLYNKQIFDEKIELFLCKSINNIEILEYFLSLGNYNEYAYYLLKSSISYNNFEVVEYLIEKFNFLIEDSLSIDFINTKSRNKIIKYLINKGAKINYNIFEKFCRNNNYELIKYIYDNFQNSLNFLEELIDNLLYILIGCNIDIFTFLYDKYNKFIKNKNKLLLEVVYYGKYKKCLFLLKNIKPNDEILIKSYNMGYYNIIVVLIENGANINILKEFIKNNNRDIKNDKFLYDNIHYYLFEKGLII